MINRILKLLEEEKDISYADFDRYVAEYSPCLDSEYDDLFHRGLERAIKIVKEAAAEYNNGWIPCSERLPEDGEDVLVTFDDGVCSIARYLSYYHNFEDSIYRKKCNHEVLAWQPLPEQYQPKGE